MYIKNTYEFIDELAFIVSFIWIKYIYTYTRVWANHLYFDPMIIIIISIIEILFVIEL